jgi:hypothetical protein
VSCSRGAPHSTVRVAKDNLIRATAVIMSLA